MQRVEEYTELIERDSAEISVLWKATQMLLYFLCAAAGYVCSIVFYMLWQDVFGGNCPLWAKIEYLPRITGKMDPYEGGFIGNVASPRADDWKQYVIVNYEYENRCRVYLMTCFTSCIFGIIWLALFFMCGKGGYDIGIYGAPWRIVLPSLTFNSVFAIITTYATSDMETGYLKFRSEVKELLTVTAHVFDQDIRRCEVIEAYLKIYNPHGHNACGLLSTLQFSSWMMMWCWIGNVVALVLRILSFTDFRVLNVKIYTLPLDSNDMTSVSKQEHSPKEKTM